MPPEFWVWAHWKDAGSKGRLPAQVAAWYRKHGVTRAPAAWVARYKLHQGNPPVPPSPGTFAGPGVWLSPEVRSLGWTGATIAEKAAAVGAKWVALDAAVNDTGDANLKAFPDVAQACSKAGIKAGLWADNLSARSVATSIRLVDAPFYIINREVPSQTEPGFLNALRAFLPAGFELAVVAGPFDAFPNPLVDGEDAWERETKPWVDLPILVEAYVGENPAATPAQQRFQAYQRRFTRIACVLESNKDHGWTLDTINEAEVKATFGRAVSLYMLGSALDRDLAKFRRMAAS